jgi:hypothetical protein
MAAEAEVRAGAAGAAVRTLVGAVVTMAVVVGTAVEAADTVVAGALVADIMAVAVDTAAEEVADTVGVAAVSTGAARRPMATGDLLLAGTAVPVTAAEDSPAGAGPAQAV